MQFEQGAEVFTSEKEKAGRVDRVVIDPKSKEVTHVVVSKGFLFSTKNKVVPIELIETASPESVILRKDADGLRALPDFKESYYVKLDPHEIHRLYETHHASLLYWYPPLSSPMGEVDYLTREYVTKTKKNIPEGTVPLREGARVTCCDEKHVGNVERIFTEPETDTVTHFLISQGLFLKERKLVPIGWVNAVKEDEVQLAVGSALLESLPQYQDNN